MHGNGGPSLKLSLQTQQREENGFARSTANGVVKGGDLIDSKQIRHSQAEVDAVEGRRVKSKSLLKSRGTSTQDSREEVERSTAHNEQIGADDSASDEERSPLWTRPAHMRNGGSARQAQDSGVQPSRSNSEQRVEVKVPDENQASVGSPVARITLTGDSKLDQSLVKVTGGGLLKICVSKDCDLQHHFEIESCSGGKVFETPIIVPGTVYVWRPPSPGKYHLTSVVYPWIKSIVTVLPAAPSSEHSTSTPSEASESQPSTPDGPLSVAEPCPAKPPSNKLRAEVELHSAFGRVSATEGDKREATTAQIASKRKGPKANGVAAVGEELEIVTQEVEVDGAPGSFGVVARTSFTAETSGKGAPPGKEEAAGSGNEVDDLLRVPLLSRKSNGRNRGDHAKKKHLDGNAWNASWGDSSADEGGDGEAPECGLRRRAKEGNGQVGAEEESEGADAGLQMRQIINPGEIDEWVERISREEEESRNARAEQSATEYSREPTEVGAGPSVDSEELGGAEAKKGGKAGKKKKKKSGKKEGPKLAPSADGAAAEEAPEDDDPGALLDDPMVGINRVLSSIPSTTGITHYDVSGAGMAKGGRPAKLMAIGRSADGKMEVSPISPMMSPSSLMKGGLSNSKFAERAPPVDDDSNPYHRIGEFIDLESGLGYMDEPRLREIKNLAGGPRLPPHMGGFNGQGWPLGAPPHMAALVPELSCRSKSCPRKFVSSVSMLRHYLQRHKKQGGDLLAERPAMMAFWADLTKEEQKELLNIKDVSMQSINGERVSAELVQKARFRKLHGIKGAKYMILGETLLNMVFSPLELPPTSSIDLFNALDEASEHTFLRGRTDPPVQRFVTADPARGMGDEGYLVGLLAFMLEDRIVSAWMKSKEEGARRTQQALMEEEDAAFEKRQKALQKKNRKKQKKAAEQLKTEPAADTSAGPASDGVSEAPREDEARGYPQRNDSEISEVSDEPVFAAAVGPSVDPQDVGEEVGVAEEEGESEPSLVQDGDAKVLLASGASGGLESVSDGASGDGPVDGGLETASASSEAPSPSSSSEAVPPLKAESSESQAPAAAGSDTSAAVDSVGSAPTPPTVELERVAPDFSVSPPPVSTGAKLRPQGSGGSGAEEKKASPLTGVIAVPVSRMGGKVKSAEAPKASAARVIPGETLVLVTKMGPRAREGGGKGKSETAKQGGLNTTGEIASVSSAASGGLSKGGSGEQPGASEGVQTRAVLSERGRQDKGVVPGVMVNRPRSHGEGVNAHGAHVSGSFGAESSEEVRVETSAAVGDGELPVVAAELRSETPRAEALGAREARGLSAEATALAEPATTEVRTNGEDAKPENEITQASTSDAGTGAREAGENDDLQRKHSGGSDGKAGGKEGRRGRKSKGKKRGAAQPAELVEGDAGEAKAVDEREWSKKATQELKSLLMDSEAGAPSDDRGETARVPIVEEAVAPAGVSLIAQVAPISAPVASQVSGPVAFQVSSPVASQASIPVAKPETETAGKEGDTSPGPTETESPEASGGVQMSGGWARIVAAAAQKEAEERAALEGERKRKQQAEKEHRAEQEQPAEAWPELGPVAKRAAPARKKKQGRRGETEAAAGPRGAVENGGEAMTAELVQSAKEAAQAAAPIIVEPGLEDAWGGLQLEEEVIAVGSHGAGESGTAKGATSDAAGGTWAGAKKQGIEKDEREGRKGMGPEEIMAFFAARWHAAVNDPEAIRLGPPESSAASEEVSIEDLAGAPVSDTAGTTGWGLPSEPSRETNTGDQARTARVSPPERSNQVGQARSGSGKGREEQGKDDGGWQEARTRKGGEGRGRGREHRQNAGEGAHRSANEGRQRRSEAK